MVSVAKQWLICGYNGLTVVTMWFYWSHFILGGLNYYVLLFKLIIWYNALIVYILYMFLHCAWILKPQSLKQLQKCFAIQYEHNKCIVLTGIFDVST